jgi:hypothetical protein
MELAAAWVTDLETTVPLLREFLQQLDTDAGTAIDLQ